MRQSRLFGKTERAAPKDSNLISHQLLYRAGFIREVSSGRFLLTPLAMRVIQKIIWIIDEEMEKIGSQRVILPTLHPLEIWQKTHRDQAFGQALMRVTDRRGAPFAIGATAEGLMVELVKMFRPTYKDLPIVLHQFSQKFRDELRARGGLIRLREFTMKDAYSFAANEESFMKTYWDQFHAYERIAQRLGLAVTPVEADSGALGGDFCHEFMVLNEMGEDRIFICDQCHYQANAERAEFVRDLVNPDEPIQPMKIVEQPEWVMTMEDNLKHYGLPKNRFLKNVVYKTSTGQIIIAVLRGDLEVNEAKLTQLAGRGELSPATETDLEKLGTRTGWVHSWGHRDACYVGDLSLKTVRNFIGGQKEKTTDSVSVNYPRDFQVEKLGDLASAFGGSICGKCGKGELSEKRAIEFGHVFKYGDFYTQAHGGTFVDRNNRERFLQMGAFGMGIERALALIVESHHDEKGIVWPEAVAPFKVHLVDLKNSQPTTHNPQQTSEMVYSKLTEAGIEVLWDDREEVSAGEKFADADLLGIPYRVVVSEKSLAAGGLELKKRDQKETKIVNLEELLKLSQKPISPQP